MTGLYNTPIEAEAALPLRKDGQVLSYARVGLNCRRVLQVVIVGKDQAPETRVSSLLTAEIAIHRMGCDICQRLTSSVATLHDC